MSDFFNTRKQVVGCKTEGTPYTPEELSVAVADAFDNYMENIKITLHVEQNKRAYALAELAQFSAIPGKKHVEIDCDIPFQGPGGLNGGPGFVNGTENPMGKILKALGFVAVENIPEETSLGWQYERRGRLEYAPMTMWYVAVSETDAGAETGIVVKVGGVCGDADIVFAGSKPVMLKCKFQGAFIEDPSDAPTAFGEAWTTFVSTVLTSGAMTSLPPVWFNSNLSLFGFADQLNPSLSDVLYQYELQSDSYTLKLGNKVTMVEDIRVGFSGYMGAKIGNAEVSGMMTPYYLARDDQDIWAQIISSKPLHVETWVGDYDNDISNFIKFDVWLATVTKGYTPNARGDFLGNPIEFESIRTSTDAGPCLFTISFGSWIGQTGYSGTATDFMVVND